MTDTIIFPNLHLTLHVGRNIRIGGFTIAYYGIIIAIGMLIGVNLILREAKRTGQKEDDYLDLCIWGLIAAVVGCRIYYVAFRWDDYRDNLLEIFDLRAGGLAIYGGIIGAVLMIGILTKLVKKISFWQVADTVVLGLVIGQVLGRWGNFFNREVFGEYTNNLLAMQLPVSAIRTSSEISSTMAQHMVTIGGETFIQVAPTFLYESLWNLALFVILMLLRKHIRFRGQQFWTYMLGYGIGRFWIEGVRTDQLYLWNTWIPVSQLLAGILALLGFLVLLIGLIRSRKHPLREREPEKKKALQTAGTNRPGEVQLLDLNDESDAVERETGFGQEGQKSEEEK